MASDRLSREQWLDHGLQNLAAVGFTSLKADKLAKSLGVSRGSFYWHFKNLADFHAAVLARWRTLATSGVIVQLEGAGMSAEQKLRNLLLVAATGDLSLEQAVRAWAFSDPAVKQTTAEIDLERLGYVQQLLEEMGIEPASARIRAHVVYASYLGQIVLNKEVTADQQHQIIEQLMRLAAP